MTKQRKGPQVYLADARTGDQRPIARANELVTNKRRYDARRLIGEAHRIWRAEWSSKQLLQGIVLEDGMDPASTSEFRRKSCDRAVALRASEIALKHDANDTRAQAVIAWSAEQLRL